MTENELLKRERELLEQELELINKERELIRKERELLGLDIQTSEKELNDNTELCDEYDIGDVAITPNEQSLLLNNRDIEKSEIAELSETELQAILMKSEAEYNEIVPDAKPKGVLTTVLLCGILILIGLTVSTVIKTNKVVNGDNISGMISTSFDDESNSLVIKSYLDLE